MTGTARTRLCGIDSETSICEGEEIMAVAIDDQQEGDFADVLDEVTLKFFKASPTAILPFGASTLSH